MGNPQVVTFFGDAHLSFTRCPHIGAGVAFVGYLLSRVSFILPYGLGLLPTALLLCCWLVDGGFTVHAISLQGWDVYSTLLYTYVVVLFAMNVVTM